MPREINLLDSLKLQGRLWNPYLLSVDQRPHIHISGNASGNSFVGTKFSAMENLAKWSTATITQVTDANRPIADTYVNGKLAVRFTTSLRFNVANSAKGNTGIVALYNDTSTVSYTTVCGTTYNTGGGNYGTWHGHVNDTRLFSSQYTSPEARNGTTMFNGRIIDPVNVVSRPDNLTIFSNICSGSHQESVTRLGADDYTVQNRSIIGVVCELMIWTVTNPTLRTIQLCEGYIAWSWMNQDMLSGDHPFKNKPPMIGD